MPSPSADTIYRQLMTKSMHAARPCHEMTLIIFQTMDIEDIEKVQYTTSTHNINFNDTLVTVKTVSSGGYFIAEYCADDIIVVLIDFEPYNSILKYHLDTQLNRTGNRVMESSPQM